MTLSDRQSKGRKRERENERERERMKEREKEREKRGEESTTIFFLIGNSTINTKM